MNTTFSLYHVDAFTGTLFTGNPAAVCVLPHWLSDVTLHAIAKENNLPVTAFLVREYDRFNIRWITPEYELDLCGHGSLSAAYVVFNYLMPDVHSIDFQSPKERILVTRAQELITLNFPAKIVEPVKLPLLSQALGVSPAEVYQYKDERCLAVYPSEAVVKQLDPDIGLLKKLPHRGLVVTAPGQLVDFVSRTFYPYKSISEDPVTGASHCLLAPYWAQRLHKTTFHAYQVSARGGEIWCEYQNDRVLISGKAVLYMQGTVTCPF